MAEKKTKSRSFSTTDQFDIQLTSISDKLGHLSESETLRYCVAQIHQKEFPDYIYKRSATDIAKRDKLVSERLSQALEPIVVAEAEIGNGIHVTAANGEDYYIVHTFGNSIYPIKLSNIRDELPEIQDIIGYHKLKIEKGEPVSYRLTPDMVYYLKHDEGIDIIETHATETNNETKENQD